MVSNNPQWLIYHIRITNQPTNQPTLDLSPTYQVWISNLQWATLFAFNFKTMSSSSYRAISMDIPDPPSLPLPIVHCFRQILKATSRIGTELLYVGSSWSSCFCSSIWRGPQEYITYDLVPSSPAASCMFGSSNFNSFHDRWFVVV